MDPLYNPRILEHTTTFGRETAGATDANGTTWVDLKDLSSLSVQTMLCGFKVTTAGTWAGNAKIRITDGSGNKLWPFGDELVQGTDFVSGTQYELTFPINVTTAKGYKFQFRSSDGGDGAGETLALNNLDKVEVDLT